MAMPSWTHLGVGIGLTALLITAVVKASGPGNVRFVNFKSQNGAKTTTIRITRLENGLFEAAAWGEGIVFQSIPDTAPLATYTFAKGAAVSANGNPNVISFLHDALPDIPVTNLFVQEGSERCARPGCEVPQ